MAEKKDHMHVQQMKIADLAKLSGFSVSTLYEYLRSGVLSPPEKESPTKAYFNRGHLDRLTEIRQLKTKGLALAEIRERYRPGMDSEEDSRKTSEDVRIAIVDKALELFSRFHYENTKISDITEALDMGNGTFYRYFKSKEELFLDCLERLPKVLVPRDAWAEVEKEQDFIMRLKKRGYAMLNAFPSYIGILNYAKLSLGKNDLTLSRKAAECIRSLVRPLRDDLKRAIEQGVVRDVDAELCAYLLLGINETFGYLLLIDPEYPVEKGFSAIEDFLTHALARRRRRPEEDVKFVITDTSDQVIEVGDLRFDGETRVNGRYLGGTLQIPVRDIVSIDFLVRDSDTHAALSLRNTETATLVLPSDMAISGRTRLGLFSISSSKVRQIRAFELVNRPHMG